MNDGPLAFGAIDDVVVVSGLPRSGTSMMMRMLEAGGLPLLVDEARDADADNVHGYFEFEPVKRTSRDATWLEAAPGRAVKVIHVLLRDLPLTYRYRVIMMHRDMDEVLLSQDVMLRRNGEKTTGLPKQVLKRVLEAQMEAIAEWLAGRPEFISLDVDYASAIGDPLREAGRVATFLGVADAVAARMAAAVDPGMYRNRAFRGREGSHLEVSHSSTELEH